ncbi:hypothetical protein [Virgibacillus sp. Bac332]|uniref:hypothetical protein n=1 Tax=Virgibacillus sp. Bac332 TaxID=2419842 RepID=UPI000EF52FB8|nr:hypothetical protein [Virgibacillus sp. Bac332]
MKSSSLWSILFIVLGLFFFGLNWIMESYFESIVLIGAIFLLLGGVLSFIAILKKEKGSLKFISFASFFIILFLITWFEPFQVIRIIAWLKNIT